MELFSGWDSLTVMTVTLDALVLATFFFIVFRNLQAMRVTGLLKGAILVVGMWLFARLFSLKMTESIVTIILQYAFLAVIIMFPKEFRGMLDRFGRRKVFSWNRDRLISMESRKELVRSIMDLSRKKRGALIVIAREDDLQQEIDSGTLLGEVNIKKEVIDLLFSSDSELNNGAVIIRDNAIVSANSRLPIVENQQLQRWGAGSRHLGAVGIVQEKDSIAIAVSADTGKITLVGYIGKNLSVDLGLELKEFNIQAGVDEQALLMRIDKLIQGKGDSKKVKSKKVKDKPMNTKKGKNKPERKNKKGEDTSSSGFFS
ncbi:diadenylate cyclase [Bacillus licheniformis]